MVDMIDKFDKRLVAKAKKRIASYSHSRGTVIEDGGPLRVLIVPDRLSVPGMVKLYRHMKANPDIVWTNKSNEWMRQYSSVETWFEWFRDCLTRKIFSKGPQPGQEIDTSEAISDLAARFDFASEVDDLSEEEILETIKNNLARPALNPPSRDE